MFGTGRRGPLASIPAPPGALLAAALLPILLGGCASPGAPAAAPSPPARLGAHARPSLSDALRSGRDLGPVAPATAVDLVLGLRGRDPAGLSAIVAGNPRLGAAEYAARFGPDPAAVAPVRRRLEGAGFTTSWRPGDLELRAQGTAAQAESLLGVGIHAHSGPDGQRFRAATGRVSLPTELAGVVTGVTGLDDYPVVERDAVPDGGVAPADVSTFYDMNPLRNAGIDGSGVTIVLPESDRFDQADLDAYASKNNLPPFNVKVRADWGGVPSALAGEAELDLEIVHAIAPGARLIVYYIGGGGAGTFVAAEDAMVSENPGAIVSSSNSLCENGDYAAIADQLIQVTQKAAATGTSWFQSTGDYGAYGCTAFGDPNSLALKGPAGSPFVTSVGGTTVFLGQRSGYFREAAWGEPLEGGGGGGGLDKYSKRPDFQTGPGVDTPDSNGMRQVPDVAALADPLSGWSLFIGGKPAQEGGTSAASPLWAAMAALLDQDLVQKGLKPVGYFTPTVYYLGQNAASLPAPPFHDITQGNNLHYVATPGWDFCTGWGSPDLGALADDLEQVERAGH